MTPSHSEEEGDKSSESGGSVVSKKSSASVSNNNENNTSKEGDEGSGSDASSPSSGSGSEDNSDLDEDDDVENKGDEEDGDKSEELSDDGDEDVDGEGTQSGTSGSGSGSDSNRSRSRSKSGSGSRSSSNSSGEGSQLSDSDRGKRRRSKGDDADGKFWEDDPEFYGIRRSHRPRVEPKQTKTSDVHAGHKRGSSKKFKGKAKRRKISTEEDASDEEVSRTIRKRANEVSYKEQESEDENDLVSDAETDEGGHENGVSLEPEEHVETIERVMDSRMGKKGATGSGTTIYTVLEKGDPNEIGEGTEKEKQFFIKWVGWSHLHNTWESLETLQEMKVKGLKKLDNFCKKEDEHNRWRMRASPEDVEYVECQLELQQELVKSYVLAERIIAERNVEEEDHKIHKEYFVKWESLPYADATWESADLIKNRSPDVIKDFKRREGSNRTPSTSSKYLRSRPKFSQIKSQPDYVKGDALDLVLRDYQMDGLNWLVHSWCKENSVILADEMGLGKTIQTICFLAYLFEQYSLHGPFLLVVPLSTMAAWQKEFAQWAPQVNVVVYLGDIASRQIIQDYEWFFKGTRKLKFNAILTTYEIVLKDKDWLNRVSWAALMIDEAHRLKNQDSLLYKSLVDFDSNHRLLITGTPLQNSLKELWSLLHFIMPHKFDDWEYFEKEHSESATKGYTKLHKQLEPFILRRVKKDVEKSLPSKVEQILRVEMTMVQRQYYKWILTKNYTALRKGLKGSASSFINVVMELKKCCNHATLTKPLEQNLGDSLSQLIKGSGKLMLLDKLLVRLKDTGHRVLIFSQMVMMLDIIAEYLQLRRFPFQRLDGSIKGDIRKQALDHFNAEGSQDFCFLLSTRAGGLGINLATADTVIIFDSDWNPQNDLQAQARAHRIGQKNQVMIYRLVTKNSVEEDIVERAKKKMVLDHLVIQRMDTTGRTVLDKGSKSGISGTPFNKDELTAILKFGAEELFKEEENVGDDNCDIDEILRRAETHEEAARPGDELLSAFKVASFAVNEDEELPEPAPSKSRNSAIWDKDWDDIIPEDLRKKVEAEEKEKEMAELYLPPRARTAVNDSKGQPLGNEALNRKARNKKRKRGGDKESEESESDEEGGPKKRGRPRHRKDGVKVKGFTDPQVKKFLKSLKKFPAPLLRIEKIAEDCGMIDVPHADLKKLAEQLLQGCMDAIAEQRANVQVPIKEEPKPQQPEPDSTTPGGEVVKKKPAKPREKGPTFKVCGVSINARTMFIAVEEMEALGEVIPVDPIARQNWKFTEKTRAPGFDVEWGEAEDTRLLLGIYEYGNGSWEQIREADPLLKEKIFLEGDKKPLVKHIALRTDHLLRVLKKHHALAKTKLTKKKGPRVKKEPGSADAVENGIIKGKAKGKRDPKKKKNAGPMHFSAQAEPTPVAFLGEMDPKIFMECKEKMRPVKKALKSLDNPDTDLTEKEQIAQTKACLVEIGQRIRECIKTFPDLDEGRKWKSYLWDFVSKFTEFDAKKLHHVYKKAMKQEKEKGKSKNSKKDKSRDKERDKKNDRRDRDRGERDRDKKMKVKEKGSRLEESSQSSYHENSNSSHPGDFHHRDRDRESKTQPGGRPFDFNRQGLPPPPPSSSSSKDYNYKAYREERTRDSRDPRGDPRSSMYHNQHQPPHQSQYQPPQQQQPHPYSSPYRGDRSDRPPKMKDPRERDGFYNHNYQHQPYRDDRNRAPRDPRERDRDSF